MRLASSLVRVVSLTAVLLSACQPEQPLSQSGDDAGMDGGVAVRSTTQALETSLCGPTAALQAGAPWPMRGGCPTHAGRSSEYGSLTNGRNWERDTFGDVRGSVAVAADGSIYIPGDDTFGFNGKLHKLNPSTGAIQSLPLGGITRTTPAIASDGTVYVTSESKKLHAIDPVTFKERWFYATGGPISSSPAIGPDGVVYFGSSDKSVYAITPGTSKGTKKWIQPTGGAVVSSPALSLDAKTVYIGSDDTYLYAFDAATGAVRWKSKLPAAVQSSPAVGRFNHVYVASGARLYAMDATTGIIAWDKALGAGTVYSPAVADSGVIYVGTSFTAGIGGSLYALTPDGRILWQYDTLGGVESTPIVGRAGNLFFGCNDGSLYALSPAGKQIWKYQSLGPVRSSPAIAKGGAIIYGSDDNKIYSVGVGTPLVGAGGVCTSDAACEPELLCGVGNGPRFGKPAGTNACWIPSCENKIQDPGETEVDCGGLCGSCTNVCSLACTIGSQVTPPALEVLSFSQGAFVRGSLGTYQTGANSIAVARGDQLRYEDRGDGNGRVALFEGPRTNRMVWSESMGHLPEWWKGIGLTPTMTLTEDAAVSPDGLQNADRWMAAAGANAARAQTIINAMPAGSLSTWLRLTDPASFNAASPLKTRAVLTDLTGGWYNEVLDWSLPAAWERRSRVTTPATTSTAVQMSHKGAWPGNATQFPALPAADYAVWGWQIEEGLFPSSYIPTQESAVTRKVDQVLFETTVVPAWLRTGQWQIDVLPLYSSAEIATTDEFVLMAWEGGQLSLAKDATGGLIKLVSGTTISKRTIAWTRNKKLTLTIDAAAKTLQVLGAAAGDGSQSYGSIAIGGTGRVGIGALLNGTIPAFARLSEPRKVASATLACVPDADCIVCGDGIVVNGIEVCDPGRNPLCNKTCTSAPGLTECQANLDCGPGQGCPAKPNGEAFGASSLRRFCVSIPLCIETVTPECGPGSAPCGACPCTPSPSPSCDSKQCGQDSSDSCGGTCTGYCDRGEAGCRTDGDCRAGFLCGKGVAWRFNGGSPAQSANACWPSFCDDVDPRRQNCGTVSSECGLCDPSTLDTCFFGPLCKNGTANCASGTHENEIGVCVADDPVDVFDNVATTAVGALPGSFGVGASGNANYTIPIFTTPGRAGLTPQLSLGYSSAAGNGTLGLGWSVNGLSSISLCANTIAQDGYLRNSEASFCLDGARLIPVSYANNETRWRTEFDSFVQITSPGDQFAKSPARDMTPPSFVAKHKDGRVMVYGGDDSSKMNTRIPILMQGSYGGSITTRSWALTQISDPAGNRISIKYSKFQKKQGNASLDAELLLRWIGYNFSKSGADDALNEIVFEYAGEDGPIPGLCRITNIPVIGAMEQCHRVDELHGYAYGSPVEQTHRLRRLKVHANGKIVRSYDLTGSTTENGLSVVSAVTECAYDRAGQKTCRAPTSFDYEPIDLSLQDAIPAPGRADRQWISLDWNGDGRDDAAMYGGRAWSIFLGTATGLETNADVVLETSVERDVPGPAKHDLSQAFPTDFDGDGVTDLLVETTTGGGKLALERFKRGSSRTNVAIPWPSGHPRKNAAFVPFDMDGDHLQDLLYCTGDGEGWMVFPNKRGTLGAPKPVGAFGPGLASGFCDDATVIDLPDGRQAVVSSNLSSNAYWMLLQWDGRPLNALLELNVKPSSHRLVSAFDSNGDGLRDLLFVSRKSSDYHWWLNTGAGFSVTAGPPWIQGGSGKNEELARAVAISTADFDLDGRTDLVIGSKSGAKVSWKVFRGANLAGDPIKVSELSGTEQGLLLLDVNGDGRQDYFGNGVIRLGKSPAANLLKTVRIRTHAQDVPDRIEIAYATGIGADVYTPGRTGVDCDRAGTTAACVTRLPGPVVKSYTRKAYRQDPSAQPPQETQGAGEGFTYADARVDRLGRGFIGFRQRSIQRYGFGGEELSLITEDYDLSVLNEGPAGPFTVRDPALGQPEASKYNYYYYPYAGKARTVTTVQMLPLNALTVSQAAATRVGKIETDFKVKSSDFNHRFVVMKSNQETITEMDKVVSQSRSEFTHDQFGNLKMSVTTWPLQPGQGEGTSFSYDHESNTTRIAKWQVGLVKYLTQASGVPGPGPGRSFVRNTEFGYDDAGLIESVIERGAAGVPRDGLINANAPTKLGTLFYRDEWGNVNLVAQIPGTLYQYPEGSTPIRVWSTSFDSRGVFVEETQNPEGHVERFDRSYRDGQLRRHDDPNGLTTTWKYDGFSRATEERRVAEGLTTSLTYGPARYTAAQGLPENAATTTTVTTRAVGSSDMLVSSTTSDTAGRVVSNTKQGFRAGTNVHQSLVYDAFGRLTIQSRPHLLNDFSQGVDTFGYDTLGRPIRQTTANNQITQTFYASSASLRADIAPFHLTDPSARWVSVTESPAGTVVSQSVDERGRTVMTAEGYSSVTQFEFGAAGFLLSVTDPAGNKIAHTPDEFARVRTASDPDTGRHQYTYDAWDQVLTHVHNTETHIFAYDLIGRTTSLVNSDGRTAWTWDRLSNEAHSILSGRMGSVVLQRSPQGHQDMYFYMGPAKALSGVSRSISTGGAQAPMLSSFEYDAFLRPSIVHYPGDTAFAVRYRYNARGFLEQVENANQPTEQFWKLDDAYQGYRPSVVHLGDGTKASTTIDPLAGWENERLTTRRSNNEVLLHEVIGHDANGRVESIRRMHDPLETVAKHYVYDRLDRLKTVTRGSGASAPELASFTYTATANIKTKSNMGTYTYGAPGELDGAPQGLPHAVRSTAGAAGNHKYEYDTTGFGRMMHRAGPTVPGTEQWFTYNATGKLARVETGAQRASTSFEYSAAGDRALRTDSDGSRTLYGSMLYEQHRPALEPAKETLRVVVSGQAIAEIKRIGGVRSGTTYLHRDQLGSPELLTSDTGGIVERRTFGAFGELQEGGGESTLGYTGHRNEGDAGLIDMVGRFYDPQLGRFLTPDPTIPEPGFSQAYNRYSYVYNNPMNWVDPDGFRPRNSYKIGRSDLALADGGIFSGPVIAVVAVVIVVSVAAYFTVDAITGGDPDWSTLNPKNWEWGKLNPGNWGGKSSGGGGLKPEKAAGLRAAAVRTGGADGTPLGAAGGNGSPRQGSDINRVVRTALSDWEWTPSRYPNGHWGGGAGASGGWDEQSEEPSKPRGAFDVARAIQVATLAEGQAATRPFEKHLESINDVLKKPNLLSGKTPAQVMQNLGGRTPSGWQVEALGKGSQKGNGFVLRSTIRRAIRRVDNCAGIQEADITGPTHTGA